MQFNILHIILLITALILGTVTLKDGFSTSSKTSSYIEKVAFKGKVIDSVTKYPKNKNVPYTPKLFLRLELEDGKIELVRVSQECIYRCMSGDICYKKKGEECTTARFDDLKSKLAKDADEIKKSLSPEEINFMISRGLLEK